MLVVAANDSKKPSLLSVQILRGVAALLVVAHHCTMMVNERLGAGKGVAWNNGAAGVDIFFVISGFVMALSSQALVGRVHPAGTFLLRRVERIVPLYWLATTFKVVTLLAVPALAVNALGTPWHIVASYLFLPTLNPAGEPFPVLLVGWTLNLEMLFYLLFAVALMLHWRPLRVLAPVLLVLAIVRVILSAVPHGVVPVVVTLANPILIEFAFGLVLFKAWTEGLRLPQASAWLALAGGFFVIALVPWAALSLLRPIVWGLPALAIVAAGLSLESMAASAASAAMRGMLRVGDASYSIYLSHTFVLPVAAFLLLRMHIQGIAGLVPGIVLGTLMSVAVGLGVYRWVELPIIKYFRMRRAAAEVAIA